MRKIMVLLLIMLLACLTLPALAAADAVTAEDMTSFFSWEVIGTFSGAVAAVVFIVQLLKLPLDRIWKIPTQYIVYVVSLIVLLLAQIFVPSLGGLTWQSGLLCVFNAILVTLAAMSAYTVAIEKPEYQKLVVESIELDVQNGEIVAGGSFDEIGSATSNIDSSATSISG